jgi:CBS domain-containing protein
MTQTLGPAATLEELKAAVTQVPEAMHRMLAEGLGPRAIGHAASDLADSVTTRLLEEAERHLGPPPVPYAWLAAGSQGRRELTAGSDQDNGLLLDDAFEEGGAHRAYFAALGAHVCHGLHACGYIHCPGEMMAMTERWCQPLSVWRGYFSEWIVQPEPKALMLASVFFDFRTITGSAPLFDRLHGFVLEKTRRNTIFLAYLAQNAMSRRPPIGFFRSFVLARGGEHDGTMDLKIRGVTPIVEMSRVHALSAGIGAVNTFDRLEELGARGVVSPAGAQGLSEALDLIGSLRLRHQVRMASEDRRPDNHIRPEELSAEERKRLRAAFVLVRTMQSAMEAKYRHGFL